MTLIDYFVSAYYGKMGYSNNSIKNIIARCSGAYENARQEYDAMRRILDVDDITKWIEKHIKYERQRYLDTYFKNQP